MIESYWLVTCASLKLDALATQIGPLD